MKSYYKKIVAFAVAILIIVGAPILAFADTDESNYTSLGAIETELTVGLSTGAEAQADGITTLGLSLRAGDGTPGNPFQIGNITELKQLRDDVNGGNDYSTKHIKLTADIDLSGEPNWQPIGFGDGKMFLGFFDGDNHTISNLIINESSAGAADNYGLFGHVSDGAYIKNLGINNCSISVNTTTKNSTSSVGGLAGKVSNNDNLVGNVVIENCFTNGGSVSVTSADNYASNTTGGLIGTISLGWDSADGVDINACYSTVNVTTSGGLNSFASGLLGATISGSGSEDINITNCYSRGNVSVSGSYYALTGGIVASSSYPLNIGNCYATGSMTSNSTYGGGSGSIVGNDNVMLGMSGTVALSPTLVAHGALYTSTGRVVGDADYAEVLDNNYAYSDMLKNNLLASSSNHNDKDGANVSHGDIMNTNIWATTAFDTNVWLIANNQLPILKNITATQDDTVPTYPPVVRASSLSLDKSATTLPLGFSDTLTASFAPSGAPGEQLLWTSSDNTIVTVDNNGSIRAIGKGSATIIASTADNRLSASCAVSTITPTISVAGLTLNTSTIELNVSEKKWVVYNLNPPNATNNKIIWTSQDSNIASVSSIGQVAGVNPGTTTVTATSSDGGFTASCNVTVRKIDVAGMTIDKTDMTIAVGNNDTITAIFTPQNATYQSVNWVSSNSGVASVDVNGTVTGIAKGSTTITATSAEGGFAANCRVIVTDESIKVTGVDINKAKTTILTGSAETIAAIILPDNATNQNVTWSSSDASVVTVDSRGKLTGVREGSAVVTVTTVDGGFTASCNVNVSDTAVAVAGVILNKTSTELAVNRRETLIVSIIPDSATNQNVTWSSNNSTVASVDANGRVTGVSDGAALITVTTVDGDHTASCTVSVSSSAGNGNTGNGNTGNGNTGNGNTGNGNTGNGDTNTTGGGRGGGGGGRGGSYSGGRIDGSSTSLISSVSISSKSYTKDQFSKDWLAAISLTTLQASENKVNISVRGFDVVDNSVLDYAYKVAQNENLGLTFYFDQIADKKVVSRLYYTPLAENKTLNLGSNTVMSGRVSGLFDNHFSNNIQVSVFDNNFDTKVAVLLNDNINKENITVYSYNTETNTYIKLKLQNKRIDKNGYLHFNTNGVDKIIISDGTLVKK